MKTRTGTYFYFCNFWSYKVTQPLTRMRVFNSSPCGLPSCTVGRFLCSSTPDLWLMGLWRTWRWFNRWIRFVGTEKQVNYAEKQPSVKTIFQTSHWVPLNSLLETVKICCDSKPSKWGSSTKTNSSIFHEILKVHSFTHFICSFL